MAFVHHRVVRFQDADPAGIVYFARVFEFAHQAFEDCLIAGGLPLAGVIADADWAMPLVHAEASYRRPMRHGDALVIEVEVAGRSERSVRLAFRVLDADGKLCAAVQHVHAAASRPAFAPCAVPAAFLAALSAAGLDVPERDVAAAAGPSSST